MWVFLFANFSWNFEFFRWILDLYRTSSDQCESLQGTADLYRGNDSDVSGQTLFWGATACVSIFVIKYWSSLRWFGEFEISRQMFWWIFWSIACHYYLKNLCKLLRKIMIKWFILWLHSNFRVTINFLSTCKLQAFQVVSLQVSPI